MSGYRGRSNVNVSHFLANLNTIPASDEQVVDTFNPDDLALFTNTQFFDFDMGENLGDFAANRSFNGATQKTGQKQDTVQKQHFDGQNAIDADFLGYDYEYELLPSGLSDQHLQPTTSTAIQTPSLTIPSHGFPHDTTFPLTTSPTAQSQPSTPVSPTFSMNPPSTAAKRKSSAMDSPESLEVASRLAAEEDKRRRNTAASARFRIKKKQREQALEKTAKDMSDKVSQLEMKVNQLEMENKWLKNLITEKNNGKKEGAFEISEIFNSKFSAAASAPAVSTAPTPPQSEAGKVETKT